MKGRRNESQVITAGNWGNMGYIVCRWMRWRSRHNTCSRNSGGNTCTSFADSDPSSTGHNSYARTADTHPNSTDGYAHKDPDIDFLTCPAS